MNIKKLVRLETYTLFQVLIQFIPLVLTVTPSTAQIRPDNSLPVNSAVITQGNKLIINGGTASGSNLFHTFEAFSVLSGQVALFNNALNVENIFSLVTGNSLSHIGGVLAANGTANLFFLNPNGIIFGSGATLAVGGSFFGSTANRIIFADGFEFATASTERKPLLTANSPMGLGFGNNPGQIIVQGTGHQLKFGNGFSIDNRSFNGPFLGSGESQTGLRTNPGKTLGLIGGEIIIDNGILTAFSGQIELGSVERGIVQFSENKDGFTLNYERISQFQDISLHQQALLDASGISNGQINLRAKNVSIEDGAVVMITNFGNAPHGSLKIKATEEVNLRGITDFNQFSLQGLNNNNIIRGIYTQTLSEGKGADIIISAKNLSVQDFSTISALSFARGEGGSLLLNIAENLQIEGSEQINLFLPTSILSLGAGTGRAGDILILGKRLSVENGGLLISQSLGTGDSGNLEITVADEVEVSGSVAADLQGNEFISSAIGSLTLFSGNTGEVVISTNKLKLASGGSINTNTNATGNASNMIINASTIEITGQNLSGTPSQISSSANKSISFLAELFNLPEIPSGNAGSIEINTEDLTIAHGGLINVTNEGSGNGGNINLLAEKTVLDQGSISAETFSGRGGNISLQGDSLLLQNGSKITASAENQGDGGNINLHSDLLLVWENSQITANAFQGNGGNIEINGNVLMGSESIISASSELGIDGQVQINGDIYEINDLTSKPTQFAAEQLITQGCFDGQSESAIQIIQRGLGGRSLTGQVSYSFIPFSDPEIAAIAKKTASNPMVDATRMVVMDDGTVHLLASEETVEECR
jgi:filamentous hemagglutinin family protein